MGTNYDWAGLMMGRAGAPSTQNNRNNFVRWMAAENPPADWYHLNNPLNCGLDDGSADGEGSYADLDIASSKSAQVLRQDNMAPILDALKADSTLAVFSAGCAASAWSTGGYHGHPAYIASIPLPPAILGPDFPLPGPAPAPPVPIPPLPVPIKEETMSLVVKQDGSIVISAVGAGTRADHLMVFTLNNPFNAAAPGYNVIDVTLGIGTNNPYTVQSA